MFAEFKGIWLLFYTYPEPITLPAEPWLLEIFKFLTDNYFLPKVIMKLSPLFA